MTTAPLRTVSPFEGKLLRVLRCFLRHVPLEQALPVLREALLPGEISRADAERTAAGLGMSER